MSDSSSTRRRLRIVYMGTPDFAVPALNALATSSDDVVGVITQPDRRRGRGKKRRPTAVKVAAEDAGLPIFQPENINDDLALEHHKDWAPDVVVVAAYGQILSPKVLNVPPHGCINIHASLLPKYRGAAPINWAIANGEESSGITIMEMEEGLDTGPMLLKKRTLIGPLETAGELHDRLAEMGAELIVDVMRLIHLDSLNPVEQDDAQSSYAPMLSRDDGALNWSDSAASLAFKIRGFHPWPGTFSTVELANEESERIKFHLARALDTASNQPPGTVIRADRKAGELHIATGEGVLECLELQAPGRRAMDIGDFLNGHTINEGDRFLSPDADRGDHP